MIRSLSFENTATRWKLEEMSFGDVNLLVGPSGVGKTQILKSLRRIRSAGLQTAQGSPSSCWSLVVDVGGDRYQWIAEIDGGKPFVHPPYFIHEFISKNDEHLVERQGSSFQFNGSSLPQLQRTESAIELLQAEEDIQPLYKALQNWFFFESPALERSSVDVLKADATRQSFKTIDDLRQAVDLPALVKAYILCEDYPKQFAAVAQLFFDIFPTVSDLRVARETDFDRTGGYSGISPSLGRNIAAGIREQGVDSWIIQDDISAGMLKIFFYLIELTLAPEGSAVFIDELENSLGINCLPDMAEHAIERAGSLQFVITSHHPQVINSITPEHWKLVTRNGGTVTVMVASEIPALQTASPLEKFTQLINLPEYEEGMA